MSRPIHIQYHKYQLVWPHFSSVRRGALLRFEFENKKIGYADLHPWPEFGELTLEDELEGLSLGRFDTDLKKCALEMAQLDAQARFENRSLLGSEPIENHRLYLELPSSEQLSEDLNLGFKKLKLKVGRQVKKELDWFKLQKDKLFSFYLRLDFNQILSEDEFLEYWDFLGELRDQVEYVEDPYHLPKSGCTQPLKETKPSYRIAMDWAWSSRDRTQIRDFLVVKPPRILSDELKGLPETQVYSHSFDHPLGRAGAVARLRAAQRAGSPLSSTHGLLYFDPPMNLEFADEFTEDGVSLVPPQNASGLGFSEYLNSISWKGLSDFAKTQL